jgi:hypothetical protein
MAIMILKSPDAVNSYFNLLLCFCLFSVYVLVCRTRGRYSGIVPRHTVFRSKLSELSETKIVYNLTLN